MYNLEVAQDHTFTVGDGQWVVHNCAKAADDAAEIPLTFYIQHDTYNLARNEIKKEGVDRFIAAMKNGIVGPKNQQGVKVINNVKIGGVTYNYELKVLAKKYANWRFYGNKNSQTNQIIFDKFGNALH